MKITIASDHGGETLKKELHKYLTDKGIDAQDLSPQNFATDDYPDFAYLVGKSIQNKTADLGILVCQSGVGISIAANKMAGVYCGRVITEDDATLACHDNGINVIALSGKDMTIDTAKKVIDIFLTTEKLNHERHIRRFNKIIEIEKGTYNEL